MQHTYLPISYLPILILMIIAVGFAIGGLLISYYVGSRGRGPSQKYEPYECGMAPIGTTWNRFPIRFYLVAMFFILFDIEVVFLYPWVVAFMGMRGDQMFLFFELLVFIAILVVGYIYIWKKGALDWQQYS